eukprot:1027839-Prorocentrum_minimum.AAC.1
MSHLDIRYRADSQAKARPPWPPLRWVGSTCRLPARESAISLHRQRLWSGLPRRIWRKSGEAVNESEERSGRPGSALGVAGRSASQEGGRGFDGSAVAALPFCPAGSAARSSASFSACSPAKWRRNVRAVWSAERSLLSSPLGLVED